MKRRGILAQDINAARCLAVKLAGRLKRRGAPGAWDDDRARDASARWHLHQAAMHLRAASEAWDDHPQAKETP